MAPKKQKPSGVTVTRIKPDGPKQPYFLARHEASRQQATGEDEETAVENLEKVLAGMESPEEE